ncbi:hypothetical protein, partial [Mesorhizobium sp. M5C.F.Ca.ET.164.01.1.1]|uniref:hypothetical protein n=1 Tax=Mesorhizobium sp. M5C.F.Ca.ET.164.01.1.1 TaxID=2563957 RepID=UPI001678F4F8
NGLVRLGIDQDATNLDRLALLGRELLPVEIDARFVTRLNLRIAQLLDFQPVLFQFELVWRILLVELLFQHQVSDASLLLGQAWIL